MINQAKRICSTSLPKGQQISASTYSYQQSNRIVAIFPLRCMRNQGHKPRKLDEAARSKLQAARLARQAAARPCLPPAYDGDSLACEYCDGPQEEKEGGNGMADERDEGIGPAVESAGHRNRGTTKQSENLAPENECEGVVEEKSCWPVHHDGIVGR